MLCFLCLLTLTVAVYKHPSSDTPYSSRIQDAPCLVCGSPWRRASRLLLHCLTRSSKPSGLKYLSLAPPSSFAALRHPPKTGKSTDVNRQQLFSLPPEKQVLVLYTVHMICFPADI